MSVLLDVLILGLLALAVFNGMRKGLIRTVFSFVGSLISLVCAKFLADWAAPFLRGVLPMPSLGSDLMSHLNLIELDNAPERFEQVLTGAGFPTSLSRQVADKIGLSGGVNNLSSRVSDALDQVIAYAIVFFLAFIVCLLLISLISVILDGVAHLPVLNMANRLGGAVLGFLTGALVLWGIAMLYAVFVPLIDASFGTSIALETQSSFMLRLFLLINPFSAM